MKKNEPLAQLDAFLAARLPRQREKILDRVQRRIEAGEDIDNAAAAEYLAVAHTTPPAEIQRNVAIYARRHQETYP